MGIMIASGLKSVKKFRDYKFCFKWICSWFIMTVSGLFLILDLFFFAYVHP